jgi:hypothetical protein
MVCQQYLHKNRINSEKIYLEIQKRKFIYSNFLKSLCLWDNTEKYGRARQAMHDHMAQAEGKMDK